MHNPQLSPWSLYPSAVPALLGSHQVYSSGFHQNSKKACYARWDSYALTRDHALHPIQPAFFHTPNIRNHDRQRPQHTSVRRRTFILIFFQDIVSALAAVSCHAPTLTAYHQTFLLTQLIFVPPDPLLRHSPMLRSPVTVGEPDD